MEELYQCFQNVNFLVGKDEIFQIFKDFQAHKTGYLTFD
jgi:hypothetical protein